MAETVGRTSRRRIVIFAVVAATFLFVLAGTLRAFVVSGASDAPTLLLNDRVVVNRMAYDLFVPFTETRLFSWSDPARGDIVLCRFPGEGDGNPWLKRIVGLPGDTIELRGPRLIVNGQEMSYRVLPRSDFDEVPRENRLGEVIAVESGAGMEHRVAFGAKAAPETADFGPVQLEARQYFVLGDNRDNSLDSRTLGPIRRDRILGKFSWVLLSGK